ncbi:MAG TPA: prepilin-type N-terminal cleavage/methylation domain-containing protein [Phycisphaerales bacterium]|nr:prepilin-type N-terminal cleavage/methylation domain-containing protein [Phycisphaerales bacterium]
MGSHVTTPSIPSSAQRRKRRPPARAFTLLECALAMVILAVGVLALIEAQGYFYTANQFSSQSATGAYLAGEVRERMRQLPKHDPVTGLFKTGSVLSGWGPDTGETVPADYDDVDDFDGVEFGEGGANAGPVDSSGRIITQTDINGVVETSGGLNVALRGWRQRVIVDKVEPFNYAVVRGDDYDNTGSAPVLRVDQYALRVTVIVTYLAPGQTQPAEMARLVWIVP